MPDDFQVSVDLGRVPKLMERLRKQQSFRAGLLEASVALEKELDRKPRKPSGGWGITRKQAFGQTFQSDAQRRKVFVLIHNGLIPYRRRLGSWWRRQEQHGGMTQVLYTQAQAAKWVQGREQSRYFALTPWLQRRVDTIWKRKRGAILRIIKKQIMKDMAG